MTREQLEKMDYQELIDMCINKVPNFTCYDMLKDYAIEQIENDNLFLAIHILQCIDNYTTQYYIYDYSMGTMEEPQALDDEDFETIIDIILEQEGE